MERRILKNSSILLMITVVAVLGLEYYFNTYGKEMQQEQMSGLKMLAYNTEQAEMSDEAEFEQQLCIELPQGMTLDVDNHPYSGCGGQLFSGTSALGQE